MALVVSTAWGVSGFPRGGGYRKFRVNSFRFAGVFCFLSKLRFPLDATAWRLLGVYLSCTVTDRVTIANAEQRTAPL